MKKIFASLMLASFAFAGVALCGQETKPAEKSAKTPETAAAAPAKVHKKKHAAQNATNTTPAPTSTATTSPAANAAPKK